MSTATAGLLSSFPIAYASNALNLSVVGAGAAIPADAAAVRFELTGDEFSAINDVRFAKFLGTSSTGAVSIAGGYFDPEMGADFSDLFLGTADSLRLANMRGVRNAAVQYRDGIVGHPVQHLSQMLNGIRFYLSRPATNAFLEAENSIRDLFLVLHEGAALVWQERFEPHVTDQGALWLMSDFLMYRDWVLHEVRARDEQHQIESAVAVMRGSNMDFMRIVARLADFIAQEHPGIAEAEKLSRAEAVYACYMQTGDVDKLRSATWSKRFERELRIVLRNRPSSELQQKAWNDVPREVLAIAQRLEELSIPEFAALGPGMQVEVAARMALERNFDASLYND